MPDAPTTPASFLSSTVVDALKNASIAGLLGAILFASYSGYWVWGTEYAKLERDRDEWKALAMKAAKLVEDPPVHTYGSPPPAVRDLKRSIDSKIEDEAR